MRASHCEQWRSYELILGADHIQQRRYGHDLTLLRSEVHQIIERPQVLQVVSGAGNQPKTILVPVRINGYQEIRERLSQLDANNTSAGVLVSGPRVGSNRHAVLTAGHFAHPLRLLVSDSHCGLLQLDLP